MAEAGSKVGKIENSEAIGVDIGVYGKNYEYDAQGICKQKKVLGGN